MAQQTLDPLPNVLKEGAKKALLGLERPSEGLARLPLLHKMTPCSLHRLKEIWLSKGL